MVRHENRDYQAIMVEYCNSTRAPEDGTCEGACGRKNVKVYAVSSLVQQLGEPDKLRRIDLCEVCLAGLLIIKTLK